MTAPYFKPDSNQNPIPFPLGGFGSQLWPKNIMATPLIDGVKVEISANPTGFQVMFDFSALMNGVGAAKAGKAAGKIGQGMAKSAGRAVTKGASKAVARAIEPPAASTNDPQFLESLKTFLAMTPGLNAFLPAVDLAILLREISPLQ